MREYHRVLQKKRPVAVAGHEVDGETVQDRRPVAAGRMGPRLTVEVEYRIAVARFTAAVMPEQRLVESEVPGRVRFRAELPLARDAVTQPANSRSRANVTARRSIAPNSS